MGQALSKDSNFNHLVTLTLDDLGGVMLFHKYIMFKNLTINGKNVASIIKVQAEIIEKPCHQYRASTAMRSLPRGCIT